MQQQAQTETRVRFKNDTYLHVRVPKRVAKAAREYSDETGIPVSEILREALSAKVAGKLQPA